MARSSASYKPGQSGNPTGKARPGKVQRSPRRQELPPLTKAQKRAIHNQLLSKAKRGSLQAIKLLLAYQFGPPSTKSVVAAPPATRGKFDYSRLSDAQLRTLMSIQRELEGLPPKVTSLGEDPERLYPPDPVQEVMEAQGKGDIFSGDDDIDDEWPGIPPLPDDDDVASPPEPTRVMQSADGYDPNDPALKENQDRQGREADRKAWAELYGLKEGEQEDLLSGLKRNSPFRTPGTFQRWRN